MNKAGKRLVITAGIIVVLIVVGAINLFVYPFQSAKPNFADVERVFNKITIPADWAEISTSENRGIAGRACPLEGSGCFHKSRTFNAPVSTTPEQVEVILSVSGCSSPVPQKTDFGDGNKNAYRLVCSIDGLDIVGNISYFDGVVEIFITVRT